MMDQNNQAPVSAFNHVAAKRMQRVAAVFGMIAMASGAYGFSNLLWPDSPAEMDERQIFRSSIYLIR